MNHRTVSGPERRKQTGRRCRLPRKLVVAALGASGMVGLAVPTAAESSTPSVAENVVLQDELGRITLTVPADWTDTRLGWTMADDGTQRSRIRASPDYSASLDNWTIPRVSFDVRPASFEPAELLDIWAQPRRCDDGGVEPFDNGRYTGLRQTWEACGGGTYQLVHVAVRPADESHTALVRIGVPAADDPALELILSSFGAVPGARPIPAGSAPGSLDIAGAADDLVDAAVPADAVTITDETERLTIAVPGDWTDMTTSSDANDDWSERPTVQASPDLDAFGDWEAPGVRARMMPAIDPSVLVANVDWMSGRCTDDGVRSYGSDASTDLALVRTWVGCTDDEASIVVAAVDAPAESATVLVEVKRLDADDPALGIILASLRSAGAAPATSSPLAGGDAEEFCSAFAPINARGDEVFDSDDPDPEALRQVIEEAAALDPPAPIAADFALMLEAFSLLADGLDGDMAARSELEERFEELDAADERLEPFMREACGLEYGDG